MIENRILFVYSTFGILKSLKKWYLGAEFVTLLGEMSTYPVIFFWRGIHHRSSSAKPITISFRLCDDEIGLQVRQTPPAPV